MEPDRCEEERKRALKRAYMKEYSRKYAQRPEVKKRRHAKYHTHRDKARAWHQAHYAKPVNKARKLAYAKVYYSQEENKARVRERRLMKEFGITTAQYDKMLMLQGGVCILCGRPPKKRRLAVEHDHQTKRVRGLACHRCNKYVIGQNTPETVRKLLTYLESDFDGRKLAA